MFKKKKHEDDDGRTVADMNVDGFKWYLTKRQTKNKSELQQVKLTKKERRAIVRGSFLALVPMFLCILASFTLIFTLLWLWIK